MPVDPLELAGKTIVKNRTCHPLDALATYDILRVSQENLTQEVDHDYG
jgi:hypothetical protein